MELIADSLETTLRFGKMLGSLCEPGDIICLGGELGAGKTTLAQALAAGIGVAHKEYVNSPTFAIMHEYQGRIPIYHMDFYRLGSSDDVLELGLDEYLHGDGISVIEWFERAVDIIPPSALIIILTAITDTTRKLVLRTHDEQWQQRLAAIQQGSHSG